MNSVTNILSTYRSGLRTGQRRIEIGEVIEKHGRNAPVEYSQPTEIEVPAPKPAKTHFERKLEQSRSNDERRFWSIMVEAQRLQPSAKTATDPRQGFSSRGHIRLVCSNGLTLAGGAA